VTFSYNDLLSFTNQIFIKAGCNNYDAEKASISLLSADLRGIDSHGVARLSGYIRLWEKGRINMQANFKIIHETPSTATIDADGGLGLVAGGFAMNIALNKAKNVGTGWVAVKGSNHFGIAARHAMMALEDDMIGIAMTNASPLVAPTHSTKRMLGTNPMAFAIPAMQQQQTESLKFFNVKIYLHQMVGFKIKMVIIHSILMNYQKVELCYRWVVTGSMGAIKVFV